MYKIFLGFFLFVTLAACQHQQPGVSAFRINRVIVDPGSDGYGTVAAAQLRSKLQAVANDINRQLKPGAPVYDLTVRFDRVKYVTPNGPFMLGRSTVKGTMQAGSWSYSFSASDDGAPGLGEAFNLDSYYSPERSFGRIAKRIANKYSRHLADVFGTRPVPWDSLSHAATTPLRQNQSAVQGKPGQVPPPPQVLVGGSR